MSSNSENESNTPNELLIFKSIAGLTTDVKPLNELLVGISTSLRNHARVLSKLPILETKQSDLRKALNELQLNFASKESLWYAGIHSCSSNNDDSIREEDLCENNVENATDNKERYDNPNHTIHNHKNESNDLSTRRISVKRLQSVSNTVQKSNKDKQNSTLRELRRDVVGIKALISQLQSEHDGGHAEISELDDQLQDLKRDVQLLGEELGSTSISVLSMKLQQEITSKHDHILEYVNNFKHNFSTEVEVSISGKLSEMKSWFHTLEDLVKTKQAALNERISTFAKCCDLNAMQENFENELYDSRAQLDLLEKSVVENEEALLLMRRQSAICTFKRIQIRWTKNLLILAVNKWRSYLTDIEERDHIILNRKRKMRKLLVTRLGGNKRKAWYKWIDFLNWSRKIEKMKSSAANSIVCRLKSVTTKSTKKAFDVWRYFTIAEEMTDAYTLGLDSNISFFDITSNNKECSFSSSAQIGNRNGTLVNIMRRLQTDKNSALQILAQQISDIRTSDLSKLQKNWQMTFQNLVSTFQESFANAALQEQVDAKFDHLDSIDNELRSDISVIRNSVYGTTNKVKYIESTYGEQIQWLLAAKDSFDEKLIESNKSIDLAMSKIQTLEYNNERNQNLINTLMLKLDDNEKIFVDFRSSSELEMERLQLDLQSTKSDLLRQEQINSDLRDELINTRIDMIQYKVASDEKIAFIHELLNVHGVSEPTWDLLIKDAILFETLSKEKKYVLGLNSIYDTNGEVDVPGHIAAYAHDYAQYIAYKADNEALLLVVAGKNPEETIYAEDEISNRRKELVTRLKADFGKALDAEYPNPGAVRSEARMIFKARLIDAVEVALSKHDQIFVPASTRLGRIRATVPTCVACDRPLTTQGPRSSLIQEEKLQDSKLYMSAHNKDVTKSSVRPKQPNVDDSKNYVMRGGFKMPIA